MALFDQGSTSTLEDVLGQQADTAGMNIKNQFAKARRQSVAQQAHAGRLGSGVANYQAGDINAGEVGALGDVQSNLSAALAAIPSDDYVDMRQNDRNRQLAEMIAQMNKPSALEETLGAMSGGVGALGSVASFF